MILSYNEEWGAICKYILQYILQLEITKGKGNAAEVYPCWSN